jgi:hypothetical protein
MMKSTSLPHLGVIRKLWWVLTILALGAICLAACVPPPSPSSEPSPSPLSPLKDCVDFEDLAIGATYRVADTFTDSGAAMALWPFQWSNLNWTYDGRADLRNDMPAGTPGNAMLLNNVNIGFDAGSLECVTLHFCDEGSNVNLIINNQVGNVQNFQDLNGTNLGSVTISVNVDSKNCGTVNLSGKFERFYFRERGPISFAIGGQELYVDNVCPCR